jgi:hypothetical protein
MAPTLKDMVLVEWRDIVGDDSWQSTKTGTALKPQTFLSVGWLLRRTKEAVVIASCYSPDDDTVGGVTSFPRGAVISIKPLRGHRMTKPPCSCKRSL